VSSRAGNCGLALGYRESHAREGLVSNSSRQRGFSLLELLIVVAIIVTITVVAVPNLLRTRMTGNETSALKSLDTMNSALQQYYNEFNTYPHNQSDLGPPQSGPATKTAADFLDSVLAPADGSVATKAGYTFKYVAGPAEPDGNINTFTISGDPESYNHTGTHRFYMDEHGIVRYTIDGSQPTVASPAM
jgi:type IV pilus assembly protein PilA